MGISRRISLITIIASVGLLAIMIASLWNLHQSMWASVQKSTQNNVEAAASVLTHYHDLEAAGKMSRSEAQAAALAAIGAMRYDGENYFWVNDMTPRMVMHPIKPQLNGTDIAALTDASGQPMFLTMVDVVKKDGQGFVNYDWDKPTGEKAVPKVSFVKGFAPWGWIVGTGVYVDDIRAQVFTHGAILMGLVLVILLVVGIVSLKLGNSIAKPIEQLTDRMRSLDAGDVAQSIPCLEREDEIGSMAMALSSFRDAAIAKAEVEENQRVAVERIAVHLERLSQGDLSDRLDSMPNGYEKLRDNFNAAIQSLESAMRTVRDTTVCVADNSSGIRDASDDLARRSENQAAALEAMARALADVTETVRATATDASNANGKVDLALGEARKSGQIVSNAVRSMEEIRTASGGVHEVIAVIDSISFQTNLLALNAGVEAARAGQAGKGFAVVAEEVRALSLRSSEAAKEVNSQVNALVEQVSSGAEAVSQAGQLLERIAGMIDEISSLVTNIAHSAERQASSIGDINSKASSMEQMTQQNAAMAEEATAASSSLAANAAELMNEVRRFQIGGPAEILDHRNWASVRAA